MAAALTEYAQNLLDGHREMVAEFGASVTLAGATSPLPVVMVFPEAGLDALLAGTQATGTINFNVETALAAAASLALKSILTVPGTPGRLSVAGIEPDPGVPLLYVTATPLV